MDARKNSLVMVSAYVSYTICMGTSRGRGWSKSVTRFKIVQSHISSWYILTARIVLGGGGGEGVTYSLGISNDCKICLARI